MSTEVDLSQLARKRPDRIAAAPVRRPFVARYVVSGTIVLGFASLLGWAARDRFLPRKTVTVTSVVVSRAEARQEGAPLFQAAGWVEPRPTPVLVTALTEGVVERLLVVEGQPVKVGEPIARLLDADAQLALRESEAAFALRRAETQSAEADLKAAKLRIENPVHLDAALAEADSLLAKTETELAKVPFLIDGAAARFDFAKRNWEGKRRAADGVAERLLHQAESDYAAAQAELAELKQRGPRLEREVETLKRKHAALAQQRMLLIDESRQLADAQAKLQAAVAKQEQAKLVADRAKLALERTTVRAPIDGKVLQLIARPGTRVTAMEGAAALGAATIVTLYDPRMLQVRADVRLDDVTQVQPNQPVRIETASVTTPLEGFVLQPTSVANIQKNTLEVKVAVKDPPDAVRPEMLVSATFLAPPQPKSSAPASDVPERLFVPKEVVVTTGGDKAIWTMAPTGVAELRTVRAGLTTSTGLTEIVEGLHPTDKIITDGRDGLNPGDRVTTAP